MKIDIEITSIRSNGTSPKYVRTCLNFQPHNIIILELVMVLGGGILWIGQQSASVFVSHESLLG